MKLKKRRVALFALLGLGMIALLSAMYGDEPQRADPAQHKVIRHNDIAYVTGAGAHRSHKLDVYQPEGAKHAPVLLFIHGGAWRAGSKILHTNVGRTFAAEGYVVVSANYRLSPGVKHPEHIRDVARAFDWVKKNAANYGGDPDTVFLCGHSAGGHLVSLLALNEKYLREVGRTSDEIAGVITLSGVYRVGGTGIFKDIFDPNPRTINDASPIAHVDDKQPPFLILYAEEDLPFLDGQAVAFEERLREAKADVTILKAADRSHSTIIHNIGDKGDPVTEEVRKFLKAHRPQKAEAGE